MSGILKFSPANAKTYQLAETSLRSYLEPNRKIYSLDYSSAASCPGAEKCLARIIIENGKKRIWDSPNQEYRCFSLSQELAYTNVYNLRKHNFDIMRKIPNCILMAEKILSDMPNNLGILRHSVSGDFFNYEYFKAINIVANQRPNILIYAYTKSSNYWVRYLDEFGPIENNLVLTHSIGSKHDKIAEERGLRTARVVYSEYESKKLGLKIDKTDFFAASPKLRDKDFSLLIHNNGPKNSKHNKAWQKIKKQGLGYSRKKK